MLEKIFGSQSRVKVLKLFLLNPADSFYVREISRKLVLPLNSVRRELDNLTDFGLLVSFYKKEDEDDKKSDSVVQTKKDAIKEQKKTKKTTEKKFFKVNTSFVIFEELRALFLKSQVLYKKDFIKKIKSIGKIDLLILTGFFVGQENALTDLFLVGDVTKDDLLKVLQNLEMDLGREVNFTLMNKDEFKYRKDITDVFLYNILESKKIVIVDEINNVKK